MKQHIFPALRLTLIMILVCVVFYTLSVWGLAQAMPNHGRGTQISDAAGKSYYANIGQQFDSLIYFHSRPSAVNYHADGSGASNKGPNNPEYLKEVATRVVAFKAQYPGSLVPMDMVTASASGLDPNISVAAAIAQAQSVAKARGIKVIVVQELINKHINAPLLGPSHLSVLELNIALDRLSKK